MSYTKAREEIERGVSEEKRGRILGVLDKSKKLKEKIAQTREELSSEVSIRSNTMSKRSSIEVNDPQIEENTVVFEPQPSISLQRDSFVLETAKMQLDEIEAELEVGKRQATTNGKNKLNKPTKHDEDALSQVTNIERIVTTATLETDSEDEFYTAESVCLFIQAVEFLSVYEEPGRPFNLRFTVEIDGVAQETPLFTITEQDKCKKGSDTSPYVLCFIINRSVVLPYFENATLLIKCAGKIGDTSIEGIYELPQFMKGAYAMKFADESELVLRTTELLYDNYFQSSIFESTFFNLIINEQRIENCITDGITLQRHTILPLKVEMFAFACGQRKQSIELAATHDSLVEGLEKVKFSSKIVDVSREEQEKVQNKETEYSYSEMIKAKEQHSRLIEVQQNVFFDENTQEYFVKTEESVDESPQRPLEILNQENYVKSLREPQEFLTSLQIEQLEFDCLGEIAKSVDVLEVSENNKSYIVARDVPLANGHGLITRVTVELPELERQIAPIYFRLNVVSNINTTHLVGSFSLEQLSGAAIAEKWIDLEPYGRIKARISALPPILGTGVQFLDTSYHVIDTSVIAYATHAPEQFITCHNEPIAEITQVSCPQPQHITLKNVGEMPDFESELEDVIGRLEEYSAGVNVGHENAEDTKLRHKNSAEEDLQAARDLIDAINAAENSSNVQNVEVKEATEMAVSGVEKCSESALENDISTKVQEMIKEAQLSPVMRAATSKDYAITEESLSYSNSEETSDVDREARHSSWAREQARKIFGGDVSDED